MAPPTASLAVPKTRRFGRPRSLSPETIGTVSERFARYMGTTRLLFQMSLIIIAWVVWNVTVPDGMRFDPYPFQFLTLALSLQASYAAPLILLAQNRQDDRDRIETNGDRQRAAMTQETNNYLARELSDLRAKLNTLESSQTANRKQIKNALEKQNLQLSKMTKSLDRIAQTNGTMK